MHILPPPHASEDDDIVDEVSGLLKQLPNDDLADYQSLENPEEGAFKDIMEEIERLIVAAKNSHGGIDHFLEDLKGSMCVSVMRGHGPFNLLFLLDHRFGWADTNPSDIRGDLNEYLRAYIRKRLTPVPPVVIEPDELIVVLRPVHGRFKMPTGEEQEADYSFQHSAQKEDEPKLFWGENPATFAMMLKGALKDAKAVVMTGGLFAEFGSRRTVSYNTVLRPEEQYFERHPRYQIAKILHEHLGAATVIVLIESNAADFLHEGRKALHEELNTGWYREGSTLTRRL